MTHGRCWRMNASRSILPSRMLVVNKVTATNPACSSATRRLVVVSSLGLKTATTGFVLPMAPPPTQMQDEVRLSDSQPPVRGNARCYRLGAGGGGLVIRAVGIFAGAR